MIDLPDTCIQNNIYDMYTLYFYGSIDYKNRVTRKLTLQRNGFNKNNYLGHAEYFYIMSEKSRFFLAGGGVS